MKKCIDRLLNKSGLFIATVFVAVGLLVFSTFIFITPFNDWSWKANANLFSQYGDFVGGFAGSLFSLAGFILLYLTLNAQQEAIKKQEDEIRVQKRISEKESFESTFFNLLNIQQNITNDTKAYFRVLYGIANVHTYKVEGREFFKVAINVLHKIDQSLSSKEFLGIYDENESEHWEHSISDLYSPDNEIDSLYGPYEAESREKELLRKRMIQHVNLFYKIDKGKWEIGKETTGKERMKFVYEIFFSKFHYAIGHYFRNLYHIIKFIDEFERDQISKIQNIPEQQEMIKTCFKYAQFIQAQMSSDELALLSYNILHFDKARDLVLKYKFDEHFPANL